MVKVIAHSSLLLYRRTAAKMPWYTVQYVLWINIKGDGGTCLIKPVLVKCPITVGELFSFQELVWDGPRNTVRASVCVVFFGWPFPNLTMGLYQRDPHAPMGHYLFRPSYPPAAHSLPVATCSQWLADCPSCPRHQSTSLSLMRKDI